MRRVAKRGSSPKLREWSVTLLRYRGHFLGYVQAASREAAENEAARLFRLKGKLGRHPLSLHPL